MPLRSNAWGLTTQVLMRMTYLASGKSRRLELGAQIIELRHAPSSQLTNASRRSGAVVRVLAYGSVRPTGMARENY
jgi:hypothetical protein